MQRFSIWQNGWLTIMCTLLLTLFSGAVQAQSAISITPTSGPPGTTVFITNNNPQARAQCVANQQSTIVPAGGTATFVINDPAGSQVTIGCSFGGQGGFDASIVFIVTSPDSDGDGVPDSADQCPTVFAQTETGCPDVVDSDQDGIADSADQCPQQFAQTRNGCPDTDGDGVPDNLDQCPQEFAQTESGCPPTSPVTPLPPSPVPATLPPLPQLSPTGTCQLATLDYNPVNVRQERSTESTILFRLDPLQIYTPTQFVEGWYFLEALGGWVRQDVVRTGGENCATLGGAPVVPTPEPSPVPPTNGLPPYIVPLNNDLSALFGACPDLASQVGRLAIAQVLRLSISPDPCGGLQNLLREISFGGFPPLVPEQISQVMSSTAQCSTESRPFPSPELLAFISALDQIDPNLAMQLNLAIVSAVGSAPGSDGDNFLCALMRGDIFAASSIPGFLSFPTQNESLVFAGGLCVPPLEASEIRASVDRLAAALTAGAGSGIPTFDAFAQSLADASIAFAERREIFCGALSVRPLGITIDTLTPEQRLSVDWLVGCGLVAESGLADFIRIVNETEAASGAGGAPGAGIDFGTGFTWAQLQDLFSSYAPGTCPSFLDYLTFAERAREENGESLVMMETSLDLFGGLDVPLGIGGIVYTVVCDTSGASADAPAPLGCRWSDDPSPFPSGDPFLRLLFPGLGGTPEAPAPRYLQPNSMRDPFEPGIPGVEVTINNGACASAGAPAAVVMTDSNGRFFVEDLPFGSYCASISPAALGEGEWWAIGYSGGDAGPYRLDLVTSPVIGLFQQVGWWRPSGEELISYIPALPSDLLLPDFIPTVPPPEGTPAPAPISQRLSMVVYDDRCENTAYDGVTLPAGCTNLYLDTLTADGVQAADEPGIAGVQIDLIDGDCDSGTDLGFLTTDGAGSATLEALLIPGRDYCISVQADSSVNAPILVQGGWTTIAGPRFTYRITAPAIASEYNIGMPWWTLAPDVINGFNPFLLPTLPTDIPLTLFPIPTDLPFAIPTVTPIPHYNVPFLALVWADVCNGAVWTGDFRTVPPGCAIVAPTTLDSNGIADDFESRLAGVQISLMLGACDSGASIEPLITTDGTGQAAGNTILAAGTYCVLIDPATGANPAALGIGQWRGALGTRALTQITIPYFQPTVVLNFPWQPAGAVVTPAAPPPVPATPPPGVIPPAPAHGGPICPSGCTPPPLPSPHVPPLAPLSGTPTTLEQIKALGRASGINWRDFQGEMDGLGAFLGDNVIDPSLLEGLYLYDSGEIFNLILGPGQDPVAASLSPDGNLLAYVSRDASGRGTLFMMNVVNGFYTPIFTEPDGALLDDDAPLWSKDGKLLLLVIADVNPDGTQTPNVYSIDLTVLNAVPELILRNLSNPTFSEDGELLAFVRDRNVYIQLSRDSIPRQLTNQPEGTTCDSPFFDALGINLYFICRSGEEASLVVQGFDGLQPVSTGLTVVTSAELGPVDGILTVGDGRRVFIVGMDGLNLKPLIDLGDLDVDGFGWAD